MKFANYVASNTVDDYHIVAFHIFLRHIHTRSLPPPPLPPSLSLSLSKAACFSKSPPFYQTSVSPGQPKSVSVSVGVSVCLFRPSVCLSAGLLARLSFCLSINLFDFSPTTPTVLFLLLHFTFTY